MGQQVASILAAGSAAITKAKAESGNTAYADASTAFNATAQQLQALTYPANAQADAKALVAILEKLSADATQAESDAGATVLQNVQNDEGTELADSDALRHDLGLPPATS